MRKWFICLIVGLVFVATPLSTALAQETLLDPSHEIACEEHRQNCRLLQMVMMGSFSEFDPDDVVSERVLASAFPQLAAVSQEDMLHFAQEFDIDLPVAREWYYRALANCLWADIRSEASATNRLNAAQRVLILFLEPETQPDAETQMESIREAMNAEVLHRIAEMAGVSEEFVTWLIDA